VTVLFKHATSSVFLFTLGDDRGWRIGLIRHPRFDRWMLPGGHVEPHENPAEAALREVLEETGRHAQLVCPPGIATNPVFAGVPVPLWIVEQQVSAESRHPHPHVHVDSLYLAIAIQPEPAQTSELPFTWYGADALDDLDMFPDSRSGAQLLFPRIGELTDRLVAH
jgi:8-oxo-dGTP pyrophosphatase MutT (NUDIX family)